MNNNELFYITTIAELGSLSRAAEKLDMSQSTLSRCLQKLENELGVCLFKRTTTGLFPTDAGTRYLKSAKKILKITRDMENDISDINQLKTGHLVVGTTSQLGTVLLPDILRTFGGVYPGIEIELVEEDPGIVESKLLDGTVDLALLHLPLTNPNVQYQKIAEEDLLLAVPLDDLVNKLAYSKEGSKLPYLDLRLVANRNFILTYPPQDTRQAAQRILNAAQIQPHIKYLTRNIHTAVRMVGKGLGVSIVPNSYYTMFGFETSTRLYRIEENFCPHWTAAVCYVPGDNFSKTYTEFIQICKVTLPYLFKN